MGAGQGPGERGRHRVAARPPLLRSRHRGQGADARLLDDGAQAGGGRTRRRRTHPRGGDRIHRLGPADRLRRRGGRPEGGGVPQGRRRPRRRTADRRRSRTPFGSRSAGGGGAGVMRLPTPAKRRRCGNEARRMRGRPAPRPVADALPRPAGDGRRLRLVQGRGLRGRRKAGVRGVLRLRAPRDGAASHLPEVPPYRIRAAQARGRGGHGSRRAGALTVPSPPSGGAA